MGEPAMIFVKGQLFLSRAVGAHPPDLHSTADVGVVVDIFSVRRIFGPVDMRTGVTGQSGFGIVFQRDSIEVVYGRSVAFANKGQVLAVRRPPMQVGWRGSGDLSWVAAGKGQHEDVRAGAI